jgi:hypothetical protein
MGTGEDAIVRQIEHRYYVEIPATELPGFVVRT